MELLLRRDRAGCYVCMDEIFVFETTSFDIFCEKERWAVGRLVLERGTGEDAAGDGRCAWSMELGPSHSALAAGGSCLSSPCSRARGGGKDGALSSAAASPDDFSFDPSACQLALELCMVGTCDGRHECMTNETVLQTWKVVSPRSFVQRPSLGAIAEMCADEWSDEEGSLDLTSADADARAHAHRGGSRGGGVCADTMGSAQAQERGGAAADVDGRMVDGVPSNSSGGGGGGEGRSYGQTVRSGGEDDEGDFGGGGGVAAGGVDDSSGSHPHSPWSLVPWKGEMSSPRFDRSELLRNVRKRYEDLMHEYHATSGSGSGPGSAAEDLFKGELTWLSAGVRIGVGVGLGVCLGLGLGVGILMNGYKVSRDRLNNMKQAIRYR